MSALPAYKVNKRYGKSFMPIRLKQVLATHGIRQAELCAEVIQTDGRALSETALCLILNWGSWPKRTPADKLRPQIEAYLKKRGATDAELAGVWADEDLPKKMHPVGIHVGQTWKKRHATEGTDTPDFDPLEIEMLSPIAKRHFKLFRDPFSDDVTSPEDVFLSPSQQYVVEAMLQTALLGGITAVVGESGSGKTTLRKLLLNRIARERQNIRIIFPQALDKTKLSTGAICTAIVKDIEPDSSIRSSLEAQARQVKEVLLRSTRAGFKHVLMIEEAHDLSVQTLKYLKRFYEIEADDGFSKVLSIVLVAQPEMRLKLDVTRYPEAREFINRCEVASLEPLHDHLSAYLAHKLARINVKQEAVFADDAIDAIRARWTKIDPGTREVKSNLYPLIVNNTATRAMNRAAELGLPLVTGDLVREL